MRSKPLIPLLAAAALTALLGCQTPAATPTSGPAPHSVRVGDGPATAVVKLAPTYTTLAPQAHRWVADDVNTYVVTLIKTAADADNNAKLLRLLQDVPLEKRAARFRCVLALTPVLENEIQSASPVCYADEWELQTQLFDGTCEGKILFASRGQNGFGYDPLFMPDGFDQTFAELGEDVKNKLSHRAKALAKLKKFFSGR